MTEPAIWNDDPLAVLKSEIVAGIRNRLANRLNDYLCGMRANEDDAITGFNEAWDVMSGVLGVELLKVRRPTVETSRSTVIVARVARTVGETLMGWWNRSDPAVIARLDQILANQGRMLGNQQKESRLMSDLSDKVAANTAETQASTTVMEGAITALAGVEKLYNDAIAAAQGAADVPAALSGIQAATDALAAERAKLAAAIATAPTGQPAPNPPA